MQWVSHRQASGNHPLTIPRPWGISGERRELTLDERGERENLVLSRDVAVMPDINAKPMPTPQIVLTH
jgi:hypothetical protein